MRSQTLQQQIDSNTRVSVFYLLLSILLLSVIGATFTGYYSPETWYFGAILAATVGITYAIISWHLGSKIVLKLTQARNTTKQEKQILDNVAEEMAIAAGIPKPQVYIIDDEAPNAFATGKDPENGIVVFTTGIIKKLNRDELQGVMAHEIAHIRNYDIRFMTIVAVIVGLIPLLSEVFLRSMFYSGRSRNSSNKGSSGGILIIIGIALAILAPLFAILLKMAVSRKREYLADASAAKFTRYPEGLASALEKIANEAKNMEKPVKTIEHMYIVNPLNPFEKKVWSLFSTHPPIEDRVAALRGKPKQNKRKK